MIFLFRVNIKILFKNICFLKATTRFLLSGSLFFGKYMYFNWVDQMLQVKSLKHSCVMETYVFRWILKIFIKQSKNVFIEWAMSLHFPLLLASLSSLYFHHMFVIIGRLTYILYQYISIHSSLCGVILTYSFLSC